MIVAQWCFPIEQRGTISIVCMLLHGFLNFLHTGVRFITFGNSSSMTHTLDHLLLNDHLLTLLQNPIASLVPERKCHQKKWKSIEHYSVRPGPNQTHSCWLACCGMCARAPCLEAEKSLDSLRLEDSIHRHVHGLITWTSGADKLWGIDWWEARACVLELPLAARLACKKTCIMWTLSRGPGPGGPGLGYATNS